MDMSGATGDLGFLQMSLLISRLSSWKASLSEFWI